MLTVNVTPTETSLWRVEFGTEDPSLEFLGRDSAISYAVRWARAHEPCLVRVFGYTGLVEETHAFPDKYRRRVRGDRRLVTQPIAFPERRRGERRKGDPAG
jgi:hypothetical protein